MPHVMDKFGYAQCSRCHGEFRKEQFVRGKCPWCHAGTAILKEVPMATATATKKKTRTASKPKTRTARTTRTTKANGTKATSRAKKVVLNNGQPIDDATVRKVIALRKKDLTWPEILKQLKRGPSFVSRVRPRMREIDKGSVLATGRAAKNYGKGKK